MFSWGNDCSWPNSVNPICFFSLVTSSSTDEFHPGLASFLRQKYKRFSLCCLISDFFIFLSSPFLLHSSLPYAFRLCHFGFLSWQSHRVLFLPLPFLHGNVDTFPMKVTILETKELKLINRGPCFLNWWKKK